jgi:hypothetical protein
MLGLMTERDAALALAAAVPALPAGTIFFASDPAGTRACLALATFLLEATGQAPPVFSNRPNTFTRELPVQPTFFDRQPMFADVSSARQVFCGTSHPASSQCFELHAVAAAAAAGVPSISFVDHWTNFRLRFQDASGNLVLPDEIWVMDAHARDLAIADGLPAQRLRISGSPTLAYLARSWRAPRPVPAMRQELGVQGLVVLYAPDLTSRTDLGEGPGLNPLSAAHDLASALPAGATVIVRLHPLHPAGQREKVEAAFAARGVHTVWPEPTFSGPELCATADVVVGFYSNFLLEARALGRPVIRYLPGPPEVDPLRHLEFGVKVTTAAELAAALVALRPRGP